MRYSLAVPAFAALAAALPAPQLIDLNMVIAQPNISYTTTASSVTYDVTSLAAQATDDITSVSVDVSAIATQTPLAVIEKRSACAPQPTGVTGDYAPPTNTADDTVAAFAANTAFAVAASSAPTPSGYSNTFTNLNASNNAYGYLGYTTLSSYDSQKCASKCNAINGCMSFNLYFERDPSVDPGTGCSNPSSVTMIKCVFWGGPVSSSNANNYGQWRNQFQVAIAGSNGYMNNTLEVPAGFGNVQYLNNAAINAPLDHEGYDTYMGSRIFNQGPFNASLCAAHCQAQNAYNTAHPPNNGAPVKLCNFFNTYILYLNKTSNVQGQYCALYTEAWDPSYATNKGQYRGNDHYMIEYSYTFTNTSNPGINPKQGDTNGAVHQASIDINYATLQPFCSAALGYSALVATVSPSTVVTPMATSTVLATTTITAGIAKRTAATDVSASLSTPAVLTKYPVSVLSSACSMVVTQATSTSTSTAPIVTVQAATQTTLETSFIATVTASPIPSACGNKGIQFAYYAEPVYTEGDNVGNVEPSNYAKRTPTWYDTTGEVGGIDVEVYNNIEIQIYGHEAMSQYFVLNHRGYIFAQVAGTYTFSLSNPDDIVFLWLGAKAQSGWNRSNAAAYAPLGSSATTTYTLEAGDYLPFRIFFGQQGGPVRFAFSIQAPDGTTILDNNTSESDFIVQYSCDETTAPPFPPFGQE
ncbi:glycoside hydrolase, partial [Aureobasidium melanogenum]